MSEHNQPIAPTFADLVASRQQWIEETLKPWCLVAPWKELFQAEQDWANIAGQVDAQATLWAWAWSRFEALAYAGLPGIDETHPLRVTTRRGRVLEGYPDNRESRHGKLKLLCETQSGSGEHELSDAISIDEIAMIVRL